MKQLPKPRRDAAREIGRYWGPWRRLEGDGTGKSKRPPRLLAGRSCWPPYAITHTSWCQGRRGVGSVLSCWANRANSFARGER